MAQKTFVHIDDPIKNPISWDYILQFQDKEGNIYIDDEIKLDITERLKSGSELL